MKCRFTPGDGREEPLIQNARQRAHLLAAQEHLDAFLWTGSGASDQ